MEGALTNADFRSLMTVADPAVLKNITEKKQKRFTKLTEDDSKVDKKRVRYLQIQKKKQTSTQKTNEEDELGKYRDRADERRKCKDQFYQQVAEELQEMKGRSIDESKYLGGDIEHTHLVKGLDFALLSKVQSQLNEASKVKSATDATALNANLKKKKRELKTLSGQKIQRFLFDEIHPHHLSFRDKLKYIDATISRGARFKGNTDYFWPGRTSYLFNVQFEMQNDDIPTIQFNSKESCSRPKDGVVVVLRSNLFDEMINALQWHNQNKKRKRGERLPRRPQSTPSSQNPLQVDASIKTTKNSGDVSKTVEDNSDIFENVGNFDPEEVISQYSTADNITQDVSLKNYNNFSKYSYFNKKGLEEKKKREDESSFIPDLNSRENIHFSSDIIRDEQGMDLDDEDDFSRNNNSNNSHQIGSFQTTYAIPAGIDPRSSLAAVYGMNVYENIYTAVDPKIGGGILPPRLQNDYYGAPIESSETAYLDNTKRIRAGMTTMDQDKGLHSVYKRDDAVLKKRGNEDEREKDPAFISDTYMECYPGFGAEVSFEAYDSDDDEDRTKMDMGRQKQFGAKRRDDFQRKEDWEQYQLKKEALPKAAFQYGRKMDDNRVTRRKKKLNPDEEWKKIEKMLGDNSKMETSRENFFDDA